MNPHFSPTMWAVRFRAATEQSECNALTTAGFSPRLADACQRELLRLYRELFAHLGTVPVYADDLFNRPQLAAVLTAVHAAQKGGVS